MPRKTAAKKQVQPNAAEASDVEDNASSSSSSTSSRKDFLGIPPSNQNSSDSNISYEESPNLDAETDPDVESRSESEHAIDSNQQSESNGRTESGSSGGGKTSGRRPTRKQTNPKRRVNRAMAEIHRLQNSTNFLIPRLPFQR